MTYVAEVMQDKGYEAIGTGGGCMAWCQSAKNGDYALICSEDQSLGTKIKETYLVGIYSEDGGRWVNSVRSNLTLAIRWCEDRLTRPDTRWRVQDDESSS